MVAPRPGLEPGTYGLTEQHTGRTDLGKSKILNGFLKWQKWVIWRPNLFRTAMVGSGDQQAKADNSQRLAEHSTELSLNPRSAPARQLTSVVSLRLAGARPP